MANSERYPVIQQHQPLRVPASFDKQGRALILQLDEIFDDIYRRFGRLKVADLGDQLKEFCLLTDEDGKYVSISSVAGELRSEIGDAEGNISTLSQTATNLTSRMSDAEGNISNLSQTATNLTSRIGDAEGNISSLSQTATNLTSRIGDAEGNISSLSQTATNLTSRISDAEGNISSLSQTATNLTSRISDAEGSISSLSQTSTNLTSRIGDAEGNISTLTQNVSGLSTRVSSAEGNISSVTQTVSGLSTRVSSAEGNISTVSQTVSGLSTRVSSAEGNISTVSQTVSGLSTRVSDAEGNISTLTQTVSGLSTRVSDAEGSISSLSQTVNGFSVTIGNVNGVLTALGMSTNGIDMVGNKYIKFSTGNNVTAMMLSANGIDMQTAGKVRIHAQDATGSSIIFGTDVSNANFAVGDNGEVMAKSVSTQALYVGGNKAPTIAVSEAQPSGNGILWFKPSSVTTKEWTRVIVDGERFLNSSGGSLGYYRTYVVSYEASDYIAGDLMYGVTAQLYIYTLPQAENITFKARLKNGSSWIDIGSVTERVYTDGTLITLDVMMTTVAANVMNPTNGGGFEVWLETNYPYGRCRTTGNLLFRAKNTSVSGVSACSVFYIS